MEFLQQKMRVPSRRNPAPSDAGSPAVAASSPASSAATTSGVGGSSSSGTTRIIALVVSFLCGFLVCNFSSILHLESLLHPTSAGIGHTNSPADCLLSGDCDNNGRKSGALVRSSGRLSSPTSSFPSANTNINNNNNVALKRGQPTLDLFVVLKDYTPRTVLGDIEPDTEEPRARTHLLGSNDEAWWPESLAAKIKPLSGFKSFNADSFKQFGNGAAIVSVMREKLVLAAASDKQQPPPDISQQRGHEPDHCTPAQLVGVLGENIYLNSSVVKHLSQQLPSGAAEKRQPQSCTVHFSGSDVVNIADSLDDAVTATLVSAYNSFFNTEHDAKKLAQYAKKEQVFVPPSNMVLPQSHFDTLAAWLDYLMRMPTNNIGANPAITDPTRMATAVFFTILSAGNNDRNAQKTSILAFREMPLEVLSRPHPHVLLRKRINAIAEAVDEQQRKVLVSIAAAFRLYDEQPWGHDIYPVFSSMCIGVDCTVMEEQFETLRGMGVGYIIVVLNARDSATHMRFAMYKRAFPGRFLLLDPGRKLSCAESWNRIITASFEQLTIPVPFVVVMNADFLIINGHHRPWNEWMRMNDNEKLLKFPIVQFHHFYAFAYTKLAWDTLGTFDENPYPAYGEDVEFVYRAASYARKMGYVTAADSPNQHFFPFPELKNWEKHHSHKNGGSSSLKDPQVFEQINRYDRQTLPYAKFDLRVFQFGSKWEKWDHRKHPAFVHPFNMPHVPHRNCWALDAGHRNCIITGKGHRYKHNRNMCWFNFSVILDKFPPPPGFEMPSHLKQWDL